MDICGICELYCCEACIHRHNPNCGFCPYKYGSDECKKECKRKP